jgi:hypothetical protein
LQIIEIKAVITIMKKFYYVPEAKICLFWTERNFMKSLGAEGEDLDDPVVIDPFPTDEP